MNTIEEAAAEMARFLDQRSLPYMVIGGLATLVWGEPRLTQDADMTVGIPAGEVDSLLGDLQERFTVLVRDPRAFVRETRVLPLRTQRGIRIDLVFARLPYEHAALGRAVPMEMDGYPVKVASAEDLVIHKIVSERAKDRDDVVGIIRRQGKRFDRAYADPVIRELSEALAAPDMWEFYDRCFKG